MRDNKRIERGKSSIEVYDNEINKIEGIIKKIKKEIELNGQSEGDKVAILTYQSAKNTFIEKKRLAELELSILEQSID